MMRYAVYYAARPDSALWRAGCEWLGYDAAGGAQLPRPDVEGVEAGELACLTREAARYGWHATLKAPFALRPGVGEDACFFRPACWRGGFSRSP
ncbi:putative phosphonate metabolism protein [Chromobacterium violaceum]|uniref:Putative phosphonate metabolism protein n=1 Tax=Chromobacterium violaceum TaxID=536 RepID=A0A3S4HLF6_CHRVL|nr:putative phosphonate metabolism protein [Chromobacterium violaceum]